MTFKLSIEYDHASGLFEAKMENGAKFTFSRNDIGGKLENALTLYRRAVVDLLEDKPIRKGTNKSFERRELMRLSAGRSVHVVGVLSRRREKFDLNDLDVDIGD